MEHTYEELNAIAATVARLDGVNAPPKATLIGRAAFGVPIALFLGSLVYALSGGTFAIDASPLSEAHASIASATLGPANANGTAPSNSMVQPADYFPAAYPNRGRDGDGNVMTYEHD